MSAQGQSDDGKPVNRTRRAILFAGALGAVGALGFAVSFRAIPPNGRIGDRHVLPTRKDTIALNGWVRIARDGRVYLAVPRSEMGQGVHTALPMLIAEELGCRLEDVEIEEPPISPVYANVRVLEMGLPFHPDQHGMVVDMGLTAARWLAFHTGAIATGGSSSVADAWLTMRTAGAMAREMLLAAASQRLGLVTAQLRVKAGQIVAADGRALSFASLADDAARIELPATVALKQPSEFRLIGTPVARRDIPDKVRGAAEFGIDVKRPGQLSAAILMSPKLGGRVGQVDDNAARALAGVRAVIRVPALGGAPEGVAVVADTWWQAHRALDALKVSWVDGEGASVSTESIAAQLTQALAERGDGYYERGAPDEQPTGTTLKARYTAPLLAHATMEPQNATALLEGGRLTVWAPTQVQSFALKVAARAAGVKPEQAQLHTTLLGGGFGRRLEVDVVAQAAFLAAQMPGKPIHLLWSREDDTRHDMYRPPAVADFEGTIDAKGRIVRWVTKTATTSITHQVMRRYGYGMMAHGPDKTTVEGTYDLPYDVPNFAARAVDVDLPVPVGYWRSVGHSYNAFFVETFMDELAASVLADPLGFRLAHLASKPRYRAVLALVAEMAGWGKPLAAGRARGIALAESFGSVVAQVVEASVSADHRIVVHRVCCAVDCGIVVHPHIVSQQLESAVIFGLSAALYGEIGYKDGAVQQSSFPDYRILGMAECPVIETRTVASAEPPSGIGEVGLPPLAPALANALAAVTGQRFHQLPLRIAA